MTGIFKYQKISDKIDKYVFTNKDQKIFSNTNKWIVTEKVHGANFAVYYNNGNITFSKRNSILKDTDWFYNYQLIKDKLSTNITKLSKIMNATNIVIYGELFGGWYPSNVQEWNGAENTRINKKGICIIPFEDRAIQEGIYYTPNIEYMVFDIAIIHDDNDEQEFLDYYTMDKYLKQTTFFYAKPLMIGTFKDVENYNLEFDSLIPTQLGQEQLLKNTNIAEGIVIKPIKPYFIKDNNNNVRCLIKKKHSKFQEISDSFDLQEAKKSYQYIFSQLVTQNRYQAVISKIGKLTNENINEVIDDVVEDTWKDFYQDYSNINLNYDKAFAYSKQLCENLVHNNLLAFKKS